jgi:hypothetical protein
MARDPAERGEERVELLRTHDPLRGEMLRELLESEGIPVATPGLEHRAMLGVIGGHVEIVVQVPRRDLERARALIAALDAAPLEGPDLRDEDPLEERAVVGYREAARAPSTVFGKRRRVAVIASMVLPGGAHVYVSQWRSAALIAAVEIAALVLAGVGVPFAILLLPLAVLADILGGTWHCERMARGETAPSLRRFGPELVATLAAGWVGLMMTPAGASWAAGPRSTLICEYRTECWGTELRACLWETAGSGLERHVLPGCEACLRDADDCAEAARCGSCWD